MNKNKYKATDIADIVGNNMQEKTMLFLRGGGRGLIAPFRISTEVLKHKEYKTKHGDFDPRYKENCPYKKGYFSGLGINIAFIAFSLVAPGADSPTDPTLNFDTHLLLASYLDTVVKANIVNGIVDLVKNYAPIVKNKVKENWTKLKTLVNDYKTA